MEATNFRRRKLGEVAFAPNKVCTRFALRAGNSGVRASPNSFQFSYLDKSRANGWRIHCAATIIPSARGV